MSVKVKCRKCGNYFWENVTTEKEAVKLCPSDDIKWLENNGYVEEAKKLRDNEEELWGDEEEIPL